MTTNDFSNYVLRISRILSALSPEDHISSEAIDAASDTLRDIDGITDEDRFLIAAAAKILVESKPVDHSHDKTYRGHIDLAGTGRMYVHTATKGTIYV